MMRRLMIKNDLTTVQRVQLAEVTGAGQDMGNNQLKGQLYGKRTTFNYKEFKVYYTISNLPGNCGALFISTASFYGADENYANYKNIAWGEDDGEVVITEEQARDFYAAFLNFLHVADFNRRKTLFFTDAVGGEQGENRLSLSDMAVKLGLPLSGGSLNIKSGRPIHSVWVNLEEAATNAAQYIIQQEADAIAVEEGNPQEDREAVALEELAMEALTPGHARRTAQIVVANAGVAPPVWPNANNREQVQQEVNRLWEAAQRQQQRPVGRRPWRSVV